MDMIMENPVLWGTVFVVVSDCHHIGHQYYRFEKKKKRSGRDRKNVSGWKHVQRRCADFHGTI